MDALKHKNTADAMLRLRWGSNLSGYVPVRTAPFDTKYSKKYEQYFARHRIVKRGSLIARIYFRSSTPHRIHCGRGRGFFQLYLLFFVCPWSSPETHIYSYDP